MIYLKHIDKKIRATYTVYLLKDYLFSFISQNAHVQMLYSKD